MSVTERAHAGYIRGMLHFELDSFHLFGVAFESAGRLTAVTFRKTCPYVLRFDSDLFRSTAAIGLDLHTGNVVRPSVYVDLVQEVSAVRDLELPETVSLNPIRDAAELQRELVISGGRSVFGELRRHLDTVAARPGSDVEQCGIVYVKIQPVIAPEILVFGIAILDKPEDLDLTVFVIRIVRDVERDTVQSAAGEIIHNVGGVEVDGIPAGGISHRRRTERRQCRDEEGNYEQHQNDACCWLVKIVFHQNMISVLSSSIFMNS